MIHIVLRPNDSQQKLNKMKKEQRLQELENRLKERDKEMDLMYWYYCNSHCSDHYSKEQSEKLCKVDLLMEKYEKTKTK